jgi:hypothetical protein
MPVPCTFPTPPTALAGVDLDAGPVRLLVERSAAGVEVSRLDEPAWSFAAELCGGRVVEAAFAGAAITSADALLVEHLARGRFIDFCLAPPDLHRRELSPALRKTYTARLKALHEQEHPKSKGGRPSKTVPKAGKVSKPERFTKAHAKRTGRSEAAVQQDVAEATALGDDVMKKIFGTSLDKPSEITALSAMDEQERQQIIERAVAVHVDHGERPNLDPHRVDHQGVAFVTGHGITIPGRRHFGGMRLVQAHVADFMILVVDDRDLVWLLKNQHCEILIDVRYRFGPTLVGRARKRDPL